MISETFINHRLQDLLKKEIRKLSKIEQFKLRLLSNCGSYPFDKFGGDGVSLITNKSDARFYGARMCNHSWCCPVCSARQMSNYSQRIEAAIESLKEQSLVPIMITFTIFHRKTMPCAVAFKILRRAYELFTKCARWRRKKKDGTFYNAGGAWGNFTTEFNIRHWVKACEVTYGEHGWHPHYHCLFWVPKSRLQEVAAWEETLLQTWLKKEQAAINEILTDSQIHNFLYMKHQFNQQNLDLLGKATTKGLYISKDSNGKIAAMTAASYICGWKASAELTASQYKQARATTSYSTYQLMETALLNHDKFLLGKYFEFCLAVISERIHRIDFSRTGLKGIINTKLQSEHWKEFLKKKRTPQEPYKTVCWFTCQQWRKISYSDDFSGTFLRPLMLRFATLPNAYDLICELLQAFNIEIPATHSIKFDDAELWNKKHA